VFSKPMLMLIGRGIGIGCIGVTSYHFEGISAMVGECMMSTR